mgnify:CR=1 FL=1|tara:strand:- start:166 stop:501 length:336 start_codon:yes stop_codon:yes gene_type:complete
MEKAIFEIDTLDGGARFEGITKGHLWNGWECPQFDLKNTLRILKDVMDSEDNKHNYDFTFYEYDELYDVIIEKGFYNSKLEYISTSKPNVINGIKYYSVGAYNWTWTMVND